MPSLPAGGDPDVPTIAQAAPGFDVVLWLGIIAPAGTSQPIVNQLNATINESSRGRRSPNETARQGATPMRAVEFDAFLRKDIEKWERGRAILRGASQ